MPDTDTQDRKQFEHYEHASRDEFWQKQWEVERVFTWEVDVSKPKFYVLEMFPYTSGRLHIGHVRNYSMGDTLARMQRARGYSVLYPMGWDAFGLPAENAAIKSESHPAEFTRDAISSMRQAMRRLGFSYSWQQELSTCDSNYIRAQQELFLLFYENGLITRDETYVNWDPAENTVLANEQVIDGKGWRSGASVVKRRVPQWFFDVRSYADRLLKDLESLSGWPESVKNIQRAWVGRSHGIELDFGVTGKDANIKVFTTRADTLGGCSFLAVAPEHPALDWLPLDGPNRTSVQRFRDAVLVQPSDQRLSASRVGVFTGVYAVAPLINKEVPVVVANYVLMDYGTGAVMGVPAHDQRDFELARLMNLPVKRVVFPNASAAADELPYEDEGVIRGVASGLDGLSSADAREKILEMIPERARRSVQYRIQNWSLSRQRYWGCPIPIVHCSNCGPVPLPKNELPVLLPNQIVKEGVGSPLSRDLSWVKAKCPRCHGAAERETDTMDTFVDSSWYYFRFIDPQFESPINKEICRLMLPVDVYIGGIEHATLHLIYSRCITKALYDLKQVDVEEPFVKLYNQGMVNDELGRKQSKSLGNVVDPNSVVSEYGADALRLYLLFKTSFDAPIDWDRSGARSARTYLDRVHRLVRQNNLLLKEHPDCDDINSQDTGSSEHAYKLRRIVNLSIQKITKDVERFSPNTAIAQLMTLTNELYSYPNDAPKSHLVAGIRTLIKLLNVFSPHISEDMWRISGKTSLLAAESWPAVDSQMLESSIVNLPIQINGRTVTSIDLDLVDGIESVMKEIRDNDVVKRRLDGRSVRGYRYVPKRIINFIVD